MAFGEKLKKIWAVLKILGWVAMIPIAVVVSFYRGRKEGKIRESSSREIKDAREAEERGDAEWLAEDLERRSR